MTATLNDALQQAHAYWESKGPSSRMMAIRANSCAAALSLRTPITELTPAHGAKVLMKLRGEGKAKGTISSYYAAFRRCVEMAGGDCRKWPKGDTPPRRCREPLSEGDLNRLAELLRDSRPWGLETYDLLELLRGTGLRVDVEALSWTALDWRPGDNTLKVTGKGGHERIIPVERHATRNLLNSDGRMKAMRKLSYSGHIKRWQLAVERLRITSMKPTPHAVRHYYATRAYAQSGRNLKVVQELLGHADISTTARYLGVNMDELREAVR